MISEVELRGLAPLTPHTARLGRVPCGSATFLISGVVFKGGRRQVRRPDLRAVSASSAFRRTWSVPRQGREQLLVACRRIESESGLHEPRPVVGQHLVET